MKSKSYRQRSDRVLIRGELYDIKRAAELHQASGEKIFVVSTDDDSPITITLRGGLAAYVHDLAEHDRLTPQEELREIVRRSIRRDAEKTLPEWEDFQDD